MLESVALGIRHTLDTMAGAGATPRSLVAVGGGDARGPDAESGTLALSGRTGTNEVTTDFRRNEAISKTA